MRKFKSVEEEIAYHMDEFGLEREDVLQVALENIIFRYDEGLISKEDLLQCADYLGFVFDMEKIEKTKQKRQCRKTK